MNRATRFLAASAAVVAALAIGIVAAPHAEARHSGHFGSFGFGVGYPVFYGAAVYVPPPPVYVAAPVAYLPPPVPYRYGYRRVHHYHRVVHHNPCSCYCCR